MWGVGDERKGKSLTELYGVEDASLELVRKALPDDARLCLFRLERGEVVEVGLARELALEDAVQQIRQSVRIASADKREAGEGGRKKE